MQSNAVKEKELAAWLETVHGYMRSPARVIWHNFLAGIFRGLGAAVGATAVFALVVWGLAKMADLPLVGSYFDTALSEVSSYAEATQYADDFARLENQLKAINQNLSDAPRNMDQN